MNTAASFAGKLQVRPGRPWPHNLRSSRRDWAFLVTRGMHAAQLPATLASLYSLCGRAHRLCGQMALDAAHGHEIVRREPIPAGLRDETLREHLHRICLDWPVQLGAEEGGLRTDVLGRALRCCPLFGGDDPSDLPRWLEQHLLGMPAADWLACWQRSPARWLAAWSSHSHSAAAMLLDGLQPFADWPLAGALPLRVQAGDADLLELAAPLLGAADYSRAPLWHGRPAETGPWARLATPSAERCETPWLRLGARLAELVSLALGYAPLMRGCLPIGPGAGLAWVETARGLLVHAVQLEGHGADARIAACRVLAPTEWNFHPQGAVARALATLPARPGPAESRRIRVLMAAYDPCVPFEIEAAADAPLEVHDA